MKPRDHALIDRAFHEAARASWLWTAPNPRVGAIALGGGHVLGHGHHARLGQAHAEEMALRAAGAWDLERDAPCPGVVDEIVVTLEPCSSQGCGKRRPRPCLDLLRQAGIQRVVVAALDPDPRHAGRGLEALRAAGIEVVMAGEAAATRFREQNPAFLAALGQPHRPWVLLKWASTLDGRTACTNGASQWITGAAARAEGHRLRALSDGILVGPGTLRQDQPRLNVRVEDDWQPAKPPPRLFLAGAALARAGEGPMAVPGPRWWLDTEASLPAAATSEDEAIRLPATASGEVDLPALMGELQARGLRRLLVEGGSRLQAALLHAGLVDAVVRYEAPSLFGGGLGSLAGASLDSPAQAWCLSHEERADLGADLRRAFLLLPPRG